MAAKDPPAPVNDAAGTAATAQWSDETPFRRILRRSAGFLILFWLLVAFYFSPGWRFSPLSAWPDSDATGLMDLAVRTIAERLHHFNIGGHRPELLAIGVIWCAIALLMIACLWLLRDRETGPVALFGRSFWSGVVRTWLWLALVAPVALGALHRSIGTGTNYFHSLHPFAFSQLLDEPPPAGAISSRAAYLLIAIVTTSVAWKSGKGLMLHGKSGVGAAYCLACLIGLGGWLLLVTAPSEVPDNMYVRYVPFEGWRSSWTDKEGITVVVSHVPWRNGWVQSGAPWGSSGLPSPRHVARTTPDGCTLFVEIRQATEYWICEYEGARASSAPATDFEGSWRRYEPNHWGPVLFEEADASPPAVPSFGEAVPSAWVAKLRWRAGRPREACYCAKDVREEMPVAPDSGLRKLQRSGSTLYPAIATETRSWAADSNWNRIPAASQERMDLIDQSLPNGVSWQTISMLFGPSVRDPTTYFLDRQHAAAEPRAVRIRLTGPWLEAEFPASRVRFPLRWKGGYRLRPINLQCQLFSFAAQDADSVTFRCAGAQPNQQPVELRFCRPGSGQSPDTDVEADEMLLAWMQRTVRPNTKLDVSWWTGNN